MRRTLVTAALIASLLLAGCSGLGGSPTDTATPTPHATPSPADISTPADSPAATATDAETTIDAETATPSPTPASTTADTATPSAAPTDTATPSPTPTDSGPYPANFDADGATSPGAAIEAHQRILTDGDYTAETTNVQRYVDNRTVVLTSNVTVRSSLDSRRLVQETGFRTANTSSTSRTYIVNDTVYLNNQSQAAQESFGTTHVQTPPGSETLANILTTGNWSATEETTRRGETVVRYDLDSYAGITNESGTFYVTQDGFVQSLHVEGVSSGDSAPTLSVYRYEATTGNVTVDLPTWVSEQESGR